MSLKIYDGFKCSITDLCQLNSEIEKYQKKVQILADNLLCSKVAEIAVELFDLHTCGLLSTKRHDFTKDPSFRKAGRDKVSVRLDEIKRTQYRDPEIDIECNILFIPYRSHLYGILYCDQEKWKSLWLSLPFISDFHFQNQTDPPEKVSDRDWKERSRVWNSIFNSCSVPAYLGFNREIVENRFYFEVQKKLEKDFSFFVPSFEKRVENVVKEKLCVEYYSTEGKEQLNSPYLSFSKYLDWLDKPEIKDLKEEYRKIIEEKIEKDTDKIP